MPEPGSAVTSVDLSRMRLFDEVTFEVMWNVEDVLDQIKDIDNAKTIRY